MTAVDTSVAVAAFGSWHEHHEVARKVVAEAPRLVAHCALETYSVLTRLPPPHRMAAGVVSDFLERAFREPYLVLGSRDRRTVVRRFAGLGLVGGSVYDGLVAITAAAADAPLVTLDRRALATYERCGANARLLAG